MNVLLCKNKEEIIYSCKNTIIDQNLNWNDNIYCIEYSQPSLITYLSFDENVSVCIIDFDLLMSSYCRYHLHSL